VISIYAIFKIGIKFMIKSSVKLRLWYHNFWTYLQGINCRLF